jgi:hypothetical protein
MASIVRSDVNEACLRALLAKEGYELNKPRRNGQTGVDIIASKGDERLRR